MEPEILRLAERANPVYIRATRAHRRPPDGCPPIIRMHDQWRDWISLPRGLRAPLETLALSYFTALDFVDRTSPGAVLSTRIDPDLRPMQQRGLDAMRQHDIGTLRMPTGAGKSRTVMAATWEFGTRCLVVVYGVGLARKWVREAVEYFGSESAVGMIGDSEFSLGERITIGVEASLRDRRRCTALLEHGAGMAILDEAQFGAADSYRELFDFLPCQRRYALSADERRQDGLEFMTRWTFGPVILDEDFKTAVAEGIVTPVSVRLETTGYQSRFYREDSQGDFGALIREMCSDTARNEQIVCLAQEIVETNQQVPLIVFTHRREHAEMLAKRLGASLLLGGKKSSKEFERTRAGLEDGSVRIAVATYQAFGVGHDVPAIQAVLMATPVGKKAKQFFRQVRGRAVRLGKDRGYVYAIWDHHVLPSLGQHLHLWNSGDCEIRDLAGWRRVSLRELKDMTT
jgi:superfamily II DNA or RNA helicase